ncbi:P-loop containing nucleoside triphosphate hydrolase protein [Coniochaeta sp. PMI_546]|nr:P-loop containing nucleoside triphosphate hydrolase protein [Coniochaeta sp. PMI_546]
MVAAGALLPLMDIVFGRFVTVFNNYLIGYISPEDYRSEVNKYTLWFVYLFIAKFVLVYAWTVLISTNAIRTTRSLRLSFLRHTLRQEIAFFDSSEAGSVSGYVTTNGNLVNSGISEKLGLAVQAISTFVTAFIVAFAVQWKLTLICICVVPTILVVTCICMVIDTAQENTIMSIHARAGRLAEEAFASVRTVHAFWAYPKLARKYEAILDEAGVVGKKKSPNYAVLFSIEFFSIFSGYGLAFWRGVRMYHSGEIGQPGQVITVIFAVLLAAQALTQIAPQTVIISKAAAAADELFRTIDRPSQIDSLSDSGLTPDSCQGEIRFSGVCFSYPSRPAIQVLNDLSLTITANRTIAIVGPSGCGKSTLIGLIERWFTPTSGTVTLDGIPLADYNLRWLRTTVRLVQQEPTLFSGSVFENVANGLAGTPLNDISHEEKMELVQEACKAAYAHDFISLLPNGYDTPIGERAGLLSGGQKQRIAIARAVVSNPRVLLLDEATSALDPAAEKIVQRALDRVAVGRTVVVIAHRLATIKNADRIVVVDAGRVMEEGTHDELVTKGPEKGIYARLVVAQDLGETAASNKDDAELQEETDGEADVLEKKATEKTPSLRNPSQGQVGDDNEIKEVQGLKNYNLFKCLSIVIREQRSIYTVWLIFVFCTVVGGATYPALAILFSRVTNAFALTGDAMVQRGDFYALMFFVVALGNLVAYAALGWVCNVIAQKTIKAYKLDMFNSILRQSMTFFDSPSNTTGALVSRLSTEPQQMQELLSFNIGLIMIIIIQLTSSCLLAIATGWKLGLVLVFGALPPLVVSGYIRIRLEFKLDADTASRFADSAGIASEAVSAIRTVASLALEHEVLRRYEESLRCIAVRSVKSLGWTMFWYSLSQSISFLAMALGFWYGGRLISFGEYTADQFWTVFIAVIFSGEAAAAFFQYSTSITKAISAMNYIFWLRGQVAAEMRDDDPPPGEQWQDGASGAAIECRDLQFSYPQRPLAKVLKGVSIKIQPGSFVALVGASGSGKTTMISLLERFYSSTAGSILLSGTDASSIHLGTYRSSIALVQQEPVLYQGSIRDNIALGLLDTNTSTASHLENDPEVESKIIQACKQANIYDFIISLPDGLATQCGSQGLRLSGGQRQRITIARALVRRPKLLLLDEATSSLDTESERIVQRALDRAMGDEEEEEEGDEKEGGEEGRKKRRRTTVAVAHRLSTIKNADKIYVFSQGLIVESGTHEELLARKGVYYDMCLGQSLDKKVDVNP